MNMEERKVKATIKVNCNVLISDVIKKLAEEECGKPLTEQETAFRIAYAFLNPKIDSLNEEEFVTGQWDGVCSFNGRLDNFTLISE
jgi:hypothetical protein